MRNRQVLIADDEETTRHILHTTLIHWGYDVTVCKDGAEAYRILRDPASPPVALLDWNMPGMDGVEICGELRKERDTATKYLVLLTTRSNKEDLVEGLRSGADDYVTKPFHMGELRARLLVGTRVVSLHSELAQHITELTAALDKVKRLEGLLPICAYCKSVRRDKGYWEQVDKYFSEHSSVRFTHTICPSCLDKHCEPLGTGGPV
ncbi:MAG: response regulator [Deltaproteobacteria bacterium]|nr:response regulator [Deltaproteobacteria bacterium]